ncbi:HlyD family secretion protein [Vibrio parahaemolyticus]|nr:HlyD family secretion protein [Vibrio parahaemolyticus]
MSLQNKTSKLGLLTITVLLIFGICMVLSDIYAPFTTNAHLQKKVVSISTETKGVVNNIFIDNGQYVEKGQALFSIDKKDLVNDWEEALASKAIILQKIENLKVEISIAETKIKQKEETVENTKKHYLRYVDLFHKGTTSEEQLENAKVQYLNSQRELEEQILTLESKKIQLGNEDGNAELMLADAQLKKLSRKVSKATTYAPISGWVTNLQLNTGESIDINAPQVAITSEDDVDIIANFNEKALHCLHNARVLVVFDAIPGKVFHGRVKSTDTAVQFSQHTDSDIGHEAFVYRDDRWIRKSQQVRTVIRSEMDTAMLVSGSKATVMVEPEDNTLWSGFSYILMRLIALFRFVY